jgi:aspartate/methionine/tyrosine aminotransferase
VTIEACALERWFASQRAPRRDLSASGAMPMTLQELLGIASADEREEFAGVSLGYGPPAGSATLRALVASRAGVLPEDVLITCGAIEALHLAVHAVVGPGDEVVVQQPMYPAVAGLARMRGALVRRWPLSEEANTVGRLDALVPLLTHATRIVAITQPNMPTGEVLADDELDELARLLAARGVLLLVDEVYRDLAIEPGLAVPSAARHANAIVVGDVAKPFGLGGVRIGWLIARDAGLRERIATLRDYTTLSVPTPSDALARIALRHVDDLLRGPLENIRANLARLRVLAARDHLLTFEAPRAGATAFVHVADAEDLQRDLAAAGVLVVPGALFGEPEYLRIGLAGAQSDFADALATLGRALAGEPAMRDALREVR